MKRQANKHRTDREFVVGDQVFLKLQPFIQTSIAQRPYQKLAFPYYGPYPTNSRVGAVSDMPGLIIHCYLDQNHSPHNLVRGRLIASESILERAIHLSKGGFFLL